VSNCDDVASLKDVRQVRTEIAQSNLTGDWSKKQQAFGLTSRRCASSKPYLQFLTLLHLVLA